MEIQAGISEAEQIEDWKQDLVTPPICPQQQ